ncbi:hypothetical protein pXoo2106_13 [Xanthomonas phage pXoo2106]|uniref:Uncharacterized protein n=1 Tax=Xanthomonas phage pXoo2106 TaxID=2970483 RepID=A0AAX3C0P5_9CAUD|nr:hypothetical protein pXoo2106_13 [Xanthomonas phage pXoo2106]
MDHMVLMNDPTMTASEGFNPDSNVVVYYKGDQMFMTKRQANALVKEMSGRYPDCKYRAVPLPKRG